MKEAKKGICYKCGKYFYVHDHHILPQSIFGKNGETVKLCPNCHTHFHEYSRQKSTDNANKQEVLIIWSTWLRTVSILVTSVIIVLLIIGII